MQKSVRYNEGHALFLSVVARKEGTKRGYLSKKTAENSRWHEKFFALYQNVLFYFENEQSARPAGIYLLEGCTCERAPAPKMSTTGKEALEKQFQQELQCQQLQAHLFPEQIDTNPSNDLKEPLLTGPNGFHSDCGPVLVM
ncbi:Ras-specific guanine nucleotide-releasing factor 2 [Collichthys lucidus]|uniref:Ras-specific guanine nucleotide-releasing factor 2 n=1 Tax=Collichthys lucidus TaxID=240159 RepID=A0A4U5UT23_COLLU|nr:Ras-specific guanine nucleotide-releasing factor 2 [Collichthys lucidus]